MNLHLMIDDKFIDGFIREWEEHEPAGQNVYVIRDRANASELRHVRNPRVICAQWGSKKCEELVQNPARYRRVFVHYLGAELYGYVAGIASGVKVLWIFWGADFYYPPDLYASASYEPETRDLLAERRTRGLRGTAESLRAWQHDLRWYRRKRAALTRVDFMLHWNVLDFDAVTRETGWSARFLPFDYDGGLLLEHQSDPAAPDLWRRFAQRRVVLLGNSGTPSNNHLSVFNRLRKIGLPKDALVLCPLAYGDPRYADQVCEAGRRILGEQFEALRTFMPLPEYRTLLDRVDVGIMNHARTQAGSNVIGLLSRGRRVFMNKRSTLYKMLSIGDALVYPITDVEDPEALFEPTDADDVANTRHFLERRFGQGFRERSLARIAKT
jgi:dTDP-N-acetylfucosamine:lipid II N-acetylfucosaminyltransferase